MEPPGYHMTPFNGSLLQIIQRPMSISCSQDTLISAELVKWYTRRDLSLTITKNYKY